MSGSALNMSSGHAVRFVLDAAPVACWICDGGTILYANPALARLLGERDPASIAGRLAADLLPPDVYAAFLLRAERLLSGHAVPRWEHDLRSGSGATVCVEVSSSITPFDSGRGVLSFFHDITEQRRVERALRGAETRFRRLVEGEVVGVFEFNAGGIQEGNDVFLRLLGRTRADLREGRLYWRAVSPAEDEQLDREKVVELLATGECKPFEKEFLCPDGSRVPVLMGASLVEGPPAWRAVALMIDLTDRRKLQTIEQEKLRLEAIGVLAAGMAHNLNNILTGVIGNASLLIEHHLTPGDTRAAAVASEIVRAGERAAALTSRLLAYSGRGRFVTGLIDLREIVVNELARLEPEVPANIRISADLAADLPPLVADAGQMRQLVAALVDNAVEAIGFREGGAITVSARVESLEDQGVLSRLGEPLAPGDYCVLEVRDNGAGMDNNTLAHAFDPFFSTKFTGRGLGLAAVAGIVRAGGGAIRVSSSPGIGSLFQVYLPAA